MSGQDILVTKHAALVEYGGQTVVLKAGTTVRAGHPITEGREGMFEPIAVQYDLEDETETADAPLVDVAKPAARGKSAETR